MDQKGGRLMEPILKSRGLVKRFGRVGVLDLCDFDLLPREILAVIGDNGAGKSTLIKSISGAVMADEGTIELEGQLHTMSDAVAYITGATDPGVQAA